MSSGIATIALLTPIVASNAVFSVRRASRGVDAMDENPAYAIANMNIAAAQVLKGTRAATSIVSASSPELEAVTSSAAEKIKKVSKSNKLLKGVGKVIDVTTDHINTAICVGSVIKVAGSEDKVDEAGRESLRLTSMFAFEKGAKYLIGMPATKKINGKNIVLKKEGAYKNLFSKEQLKAVTDFCETKKFLKYAPNAAKGLLFVGASILGYQLGDKLATAIIGEKENTVTK